MTWTVVSLALLLASGCWAHEWVPCDMCVCRLKEPGSTSDHTDTQITQLYLNCSNTGNDIANGNQVLLPDPDYESFQAHSICAEFRWNQIGKVQILNIPQVTKLMLEHNNIYVIYDNAFQHMTRSLAELYLAHNALSEIKGKVFESLNKLQVLDLSYNSLKTLKFSEFYLMESLQTLILKSNDIHSIVDSGTKKMNSLTTLDLSWNQIVNVDETAFRNMGKLSVLDLSHNGIFQLMPLTFAPLITLKYLDLSHNNISNLKLSETKSVSQLKIGNNKIDDLGILTKTFPNLERLSAENNVLKNLDANIGFTRLQFLNLSGNALSTWPAVNLGTVTELDLSWNHLKIIPKEVNGQNLPKLRKLTLDGNSFSDINFVPSKAPFQELRFLSLNKLPNVQKLKNNAFLNLRNTSEISTMADLECRGRLVLKMSHNPLLTDVHENALNGVRLCELDLSYNALTTLPEPLVVWEKVRTINLQGNPWDCQCYLQWMLDRVVGAIYEKGDRRLLEELRCSNPSVRRNHRLVHYYNWSEPVFCNEKLGHISQKNSDTDVNMHMGSSEGMIITITVLGVIFLLLVIGGLVINVRIRSRRRIRNRRL